MASRSAMARASLSLTAKTRLRLMFQRAFPLAWMSARELVFLSVALGLMSPRVEWMWTSPAKRATELALMLARAVWESTWATRKSSRKINLQTRTESRPETTTITTMTGGAAVAGGEIATADSALTVPEVVEAGETEADGETVVAAGAMMDSAATVADEDAAGTELLLSTKPTLLLLSTRLETRSTNLLRAGAPLALLATATHRSRRAHLVPWASLRTRT
ncbi:uncharacterized protein BKA78DRAFT_301000 [Phyllosticta capitalensis]|uniref:uncharacterized protein n=1 Tax=Phyllosticta capitalensis TaxID=121624 RepID=UPI003130CBD0